MATIKCDVCNKKFYAKPSHLLRGWSKYCSIACRTKAQYKGKIFQCFICNKELYGAPSKVKKSKSGKFFCSKKCQTIWRNRILYSGENNFNWKNGESAYRNILKTSSRKKVCTLCRLIDVRVLIVHHIDKNRKNNALTNLIWLCCNCHYLVHNYEDQAKLLKKIICN